MFFLLQAETPPESDADKVEDWLTDQGLTVLSIILFVAIAIFLLNMIVPRLVAAATRNRLAGKPEDEIEQRAETLTHVFTRSGGTFIIIIGFITALPEFGIQIGPLIAGVGVVGIAIGFGAQSLVKDYFAGIFILLDNQYTRGDVVEIGGKIGTVEDIGIRRTVLRDLDGIVHWVPNGQITVASNYTHEYSRVNLDVSVSYAEDLDYVMEVINDVGQELAEDPEWKNIILSPPRSLRVEAFRESGVDVKVVGDVKPIRQWEVMGELRRRLKRRFDDLGIEIPFPHRVMVHEAKSAGLPAELRDLPENPDRGKEAPSQPTEDPQERLPDGAADSN